MKIEIEMQEIKNKKSNEIKLQQLEKVDLIQKFIPSLGLDSKINYTMLYTKRLALEIPSPHNYSPECLGYQIPNVIWPLIMALLDDKSLLRLISTCRKYYKISDEHSKTKVRLDSIKESHKNKLYISELLQRSQPRLSPGLFSIGLNNALFLPGVSIFPFHASFR